MGLVSPEMEIGMVLSCAAVMTEEEIAEKVTMPVVGL